MKRPLLAVLAGLLLAAPALAQQLEGDAPRAAGPGDAYTLPDLIDALRGDPRTAAAVDAILSGMGQDAAAGALLGPAQQERLRVALVAVLAGADPQLLETAPALTVREMGAAVEVNTARRAGGAAPASQQDGAQRDGAQQDGAQQGLPLPRQVAIEDLGIPVTDRAVPSRTPAPLGPLGPLGVTRGGGPIDPDRAERYPDSVRLADVLNRLSLNAPGEDPAFVVRTAETAASRPESLVAALQREGHTVTVRDWRRLANFVDLRHEGRAVAAPVWIDTELDVPGQDRTLKVPAGHSEHQVFVRGPVVNADVAFFMGVEGAAIFRPLLSAEDPWLGGRAANVYEGAQAAEAVRVAGEVRRALVDKQAAHLELPMGGYYHLGVCNDSNALIEQAMTGRTTLYPLTRNLRYFRGSGEIDRLARAMPVDGRGAPADLERIVGSLPTAPGEGVFPALRADLAALLAAPGAADADGLSERLRGEQQQQQQQQQQRDRSRRQAR